MFKYYNPNPLGKSNGDCMIRAVSKLFEIDWDDAYMDMTIYGYLLKDMPSSNAVLDKYLKLCGLKKYMILDTCPDCITVREFAQNHPEGQFLLILDGHVVTLDSGNYYDTWDCGSEAVLYYYH